MYSGIIGFIAIHILYTVMLSGTLAQSICLGMTAPHKASPVGAIPPQNGGKCRAGDKRGSPSVSGLPAGALRLITDENRFNNLPILVE